MFTPSSFPCPSCQEFINDSMTQCPYCSAPVDPQVAQQAVEFQERVNKACNDASTIRNLAGAMWVCFALRFLPLGGCVAGVVMLVLFFLVPIRLIIWQSKYGSLRTADADYQRAKRNALIALVLWGLVIVAQVVLEIFFVGLSIALRQ